MDRELWCPTFWGLKWPNCLNKIFFGKTSFVILMYLMVSFTEQNIKIFLKQIHSYNHASFLSPKWPISPKEEFFWKNYQYDFHVPFQTFHCPEWELFAKIIHITLMYLLAWYLWLWKKILKSKSGVMTMHHPQRKLIFMHLLTPFLVERIEGLNAFNRLSVFHELNVFHRLNKFSLLNVFHMFNAFYRLVVFKNLMYFVRWMSFRGEWPSGLRCWNRKVPYSSPNSCLAGLRNPTSLRGSQWPLGQNC